MDCLVKPNAPAAIRKQIASSLSSQLIALLFLRNIHLQRDIQPIFFRQYLCKLLKNSCSASKKCSSEIFRQFTKKHQWRRILFQQSCRLLQKQPMEVFCKKRCSQKGLCKIHRKTPEVCEILRSIFLTEYLCNCSVTKMVHCQQYCQCQCPQMNTLYLETLTLEVPFRHINSFSAA